MSTVISKEAMSSVSSENPEVLQLFPFERPVTATCRVPGSKSYTIRALMLAALTPGPVRIVNPLDSDDTQAMKGCLRELGIQVEEDANTWTVIGSVVDVKDRPEPYVLNCNLSAASLRFLTALSAVIPGEQVVTGEHGLCQRPVKDMVDALRQYGAEIDYINKDGYPPIQIRSKDLKSGTLAVSAVTSSQYASALMMVAPLLVGRHQSPVKIELLGKPISKPYLEMTRSVMQSFGIDVNQASDNVYETANGNYSADEYAVETDASGMAYPLAMATLTASTITIENVNPDSVQADMELLEILKLMGNEIQFENGALKIIGKGVQPIEYDMENCPDQAQTVAVLAAFAKGKTKLTGLQSLHVKETNRYEAIVAELSKMGIQVEAVDKATMIIHGGDPKPATIATYGDHRMAMAFAVAGSNLHGMRIENSQVVNKTYPTFWTDMAKLGLKSQPLGDAAK